MAEEGEEEDESSEDQEVSTPASPTILAKPAGPVRVRRDSPATTQNPAVSADPEPVKPEPVEPRLAQPEPVQSDPVASEPRRSG